MLSPSGPPTSAVPPKRARARSASAIAREYSAGCLSESVYAAGMPPWRFKIRQLLLASLHWEMKWLIKVQKSLRTKYLDVYFLNTSLLGTHTFFMLFLPLFFFFESPKEGRNLLYILATGGYITSVLKDAICLPRPFTPFIVRLTVGSHGREYGFPSTHSTNAISMTFVLWKLIGEGSFELGAKVLLIFTCLSVVFGRIYTGMHSLMDVVVGSIIGYLVWAFFEAFEAEVEAFTMASGTTAVTVIATLALVFIHPAPCEDCPCFEDAVAFVAVFAGMLIGHAHTPSPQNPTLGSSTSLHPSLPLLIFASTAKIFLGILAIFAYRTIAKKLSHWILPKLFKLFKRFLLTRRHYIPGDEAYVEVGMKRVPSILDLNVKEEESTDEESPVSPKFLSPTTSIKRRQVRSKAVKPIPPIVIVDGQINVIRQDVDILTKIICYAGIGWIASIGAPLAFVLIGLSM